MSGSGENAAFEVAYLIVSGTTTAARGPEILRALVGLGFKTVIAIPTPNAARTISGRELADVAGAQLVESYFDLAIRPRPPRGVVLFAPCSFNSLNKLAHGIADNLALSVTAAGPVGTARPAAPLIAAGRSQSSWRGRSPNPLPKLTTGWSVSNRSAPIRPAPVPPIS